MKNTLQKKNGLILNILMTKSASMILYMTKNRKLIKSY